MSLPVIAGAFFASLLVSVVSISVTGRVYRRRMLNEQLLRRLKR